MIKNRKEAIAVLRDRLSQISDPELSDAISWVVTGFDRCLAYPPIYCAHCGEEDYDDYMLTDELWKRIWPARRGTLHLRCVEQLLGRPFCVEDFKAIAMNNAIIYVLSRKVACPY